MSTFKKICRTKSLFKILKKWYNNIHTTIRRSQNDTATSKATGVQRADAHRHGRQAEAQRGDVHQPEREQNGAGSSAAADQDPGNSPGGRWLAHAART